MIAFAGQAAGHLAQIFDLDVTDPATFEFRYSLLGNFGP
jgi:hypothetical protein